MKNFVDRNSPHRRFNPLIGDWVLVSPQRTQRPWQGHEEPVPHENLPEYDPNCYLCPGNMRSGVQRNPGYSSIYVFDNDFPALLPEGTVRSESDLVDVNREHPQENLFGEQDYPKNLFWAEQETGICRVVCFSPQHNLSVPDLSNDQMVAVVQTWIGQTVELGQRANVSYVQVFENKGAQMGASNPHPHCQIWATEHLPNEPAKELATQKAHYSHEGTCLLCDYLQAEKEAGERIVLENDRFIALVPFWAVWPFETMVLPKRHIATLPELTKPEIGALADILQRLTTRYDNLFKISFPYSMGFHQAPFNSGSHPEWHLHTHYYPPLLRSAAVRKFMVGFELLALPQRDVSPEGAAERLRSLSDVLYRKSG
jgi:UDPglucose--hexose-1-phosphate uridylyltransferase